MRIPVTALASLLLLCIPVQAQELELGGYLEHQLFPQELRGRLVVMDYSKARLDIGLQAVDWLHLNGDIVAQVQQGKKEFNSFDFIPQSVLQSYVDRTGRAISDIKPLFEFQLDNELYIDNAFVSVYAGPVQARVGRQQLPWGTGYVWNPSDVFHDKNQLDPTYEKRGVDAAKIEIPFGGMGMLTAVAELGHAWSEATKAVKMKHHIRGFDISVSAIETYEREIDYDTFAPGITRRRLIAGDISGAIGEIGAWFEGTYNDVAAGDSYSQLLFGADYTTEAGLYLITEYYHNGRGAKGKKDFALDRWMTFLGAAGENLGRDYLFAGQSLPLSDLLMGSNFVIVSLTDGSAVVYPYLEYSLSDNAVLTLIGYVTAGKPDSEFGSFGSGLIARARLYF